MLTNQQNQADDNTTPMLAFSSYLRTAFKALWTELTTVLKQYGVAYTELKHTRDIWARDYMPVRNTRGEWVRFMYRPPYLDKAPSWRTSQQEVEKCMMGLSFTDCPLVIDGGNVVLCGNKAILTDAVYAWNSNHQPQDIIRMLKEALVVDDIVIIPSYEDDEYRHGDGVVAALDGQRVFVVDDARYGNYGTVLRQQLSAAGLTCIPVPFYDAIEEEGADNMSAKGNYLNFLATPAVVLVPQYGLPLDEPVLQLYRQHFSQPCVGIACNQLATEGGVLHCVSWS
jgi:agmatine/peptidylarginine deiminase